MRWEVSQPIGGPLAPGTPTISLSLPIIRILDIQFCPSRGSPECKYLYRNSDTHPLLAPGTPLHGWGRGARIDTPEWVAGRPEAENFPAAVLKRTPLTASVRLQVSTTTPLRCTLTVRPTVDGNPGILLPATIRFTVPARASEHVVSVTTQGTMPDEVGRYGVELEWHLTAPGYLFGRPDRTRHTIYTLWGPPYRPDYDSDNPHAWGFNTNPIQGTLTGTPHRFDHLMRLLGNRHPAATSNDSEEIVWKLHLGINDTPHRPPHVDTHHDIQLTHDGTSSGRPLREEDQWLAWVNARNQWNDMSCIGHVQLLKTMAASIGIFCRRAWVLPTSNRLPDGTTVSPADSELFCLGHFDADRRQRWTFTHQGISIEASPKLLNPDGSWENFEACARTRGGKFLPGAYLPSDCPPSFRIGRGFSSAADVLRWWTRTRKDGFQRFMAWAPNNPRAQGTHYWDVEGRHYTPANWRSIATRGKALPCP